MSKDPKATAQPADDMTKTSADNSIELSEDELKRVSGGAGAKKVGIASPVKLTAAFEKWIEL